MKHKPSSTNAARLAAVRIQPLTTPAPKARARHLLAQHHYLGDVHAFGEPLGYAITDDHHQWLGVLVFCAAIRRLRAPDPWIGCSEEQPRRRLPLLVNNCRFLPLPDKTFPHLASRSLRLCLHRLSADGQARYQHPVLIVETFVNPEPFCGTADSASGWRELGATDGFGRMRRDFYVAHHKPNRLFVRELFAQLDLDGRRVSLDALHTQDQTARELLWEHGADDRFTIKDNQPRCARTSNASWKRLRRVFPPAETTPTLAGQRERN